MFDFSREVVDKNINQRGPRVDPCGTPDNTEKGEENFPKMLTKEGRSI
jgi:hypothetical protein